MILLKSYLRLSIIGSIKEVNNAVVDKKTKASEMLDS